MGSSTLTGPASILLPVQARVLEAIASAGMLTGPIHDLAQQFGVTPIAFMDCLGDLVYAGRVTVTTSPESIFTIQLDQDDRVGA
jgi:DNA-binding MarR family transcriptional regulator